ncbi:MAG: hypothetical protein Q9197_005072 [Variospora fuerteventurae]
MFSGFRLDGTVSVGNARKSYVQSRSGHLHMVRNSFADELRRYVALKLTVSEISHLQHEVHVLNRLSHGIASHPGKKHIVQLLDRFEHEGPNGTHSCLVLELLGPRVDVEAECHNNNRLPGSIAWETCKQTAQALEYMHANGIAHGDLHPGNLVFAPVSTVSQRGSNIMKLLGTPQMFELVVGYPPFDNLMPNKDDLIREWVSMLGNLPQKWARHFPCSEPDDVELDQVTLPDWLHDTYFDEGKKRDFAEAHIEELGELLQSMMQYCPSNRPGVSELLKSPWFQKNPWHEQQVAEHDKI